MAHTLFFAKRVITVGVVLLRHITMLPRRHLGHLFYTHTPSSMVALFICSLFPFSPAAVLQYQLTSAQRWWNGAALRCCHLWVFSNLLLLLLTLEIAHQCSRRSPLPWSTHVGALVESESDCCQSPNAQVNCCRALLVLSLSLSLPTST